MSTIQFGVHYMLDGYGGDASLLKDKQHLADILDQVPKKMGMYPLNEPVIVEVGPNNKKDPGGISGFVMIAESHISFHTFPGRQFVTIDVYTCQDTIDNEKLTSLFVELFKLKDYDENIIPRGVRYPATDTEA